MRSQTFSSPSTSSALVRAAWFREWKTSRTWLLVGGLLMVISPLFHIVGVAMGGYASQPLAWYWHVLMSAVYLYNQTSAGLPPISSLDVASGPPVAMAYMVMAACLGGILWGNDRAHGWMNTLMGPLPRRLLFTIKLRLGLLFLLVPFTGIAAILFFINLLAGDIMNPGILLAWFGIRLAGLFVGYATGFFFAAVMAWWQPSTLLALVALAFPWVFGSFIYQAIGGWNPPFVSVGNHSLNVLQFLSPIGMGGTFTDGSHGLVHGYPVMTYGVGVSYGPHAYLHYLFLVAWGLAAILLAYRGFLSEPTENQSQLFILPSLGKVALPFLCFLPAYVLGRNGSGSNGSSAPNQSTLILLTLVLTLVIWGGFLFVNRWRQGGWRRLN